MTAAELLDMLRARGVALSVQAGKLKFRAPPGALDDDLKGRAQEQRGALIALLAGDPPRGVRVVCCLPSAKPCAPTDPELHMWTWVGAPAFVYARDRKPPPCERILRSQRRKHRCCGTVAKVREQQTKDGRKQLRAECERCGRFLAFVAADNADLEWRAA